MRIAVVTESFLPRTDGVVRTVLELLRYLRAHDHEALVFAAGPGPREHLGYEVIRVGGVRFPLYPALTVAPFSPGMRGRLRAWRPDVLHLASPFVLGAHACRVGRSLRIPVAGHYQTNVARYARHFHLAPLAAPAALHITRLHNRCQVNYAPTESERRALVAQGVREVRVLGRGVDAALFTPERRSDEVRRSLLQAGEERLFLYVGRLSSEKNIESLGPMIAGVPRARLVLVGEGPQRAHLEARFSGLPATFLGLRQGEELAALYASADVFAFPSLTETFGQVVQEAMASGLPVLACHAGGVQDLFRHGEQGFLCTPGDGRAWLETARRLTADGDLRARLGASGRAAAATRTWDSIYGSLLADYAALAMHHRAPIGRQSSMPKTVSVKSR